MKTLPSGLPVASLPKNGHMSIGGGEQGALSSEGVGMKHLNRARSLTRGRPAISSRDTWRLLKTVWVVTMGCSYTQSTDHPTLLPGQELDRRLRPKSQV